jgi:hypothetical protein
MQNYIFYIKDNHRKIIKTYKKTCIKPERTKIYKNLISALNNDNENLISSVGYYIEGSKSLFFHYN